MENTHRANTSPAAAVETAAALIELAVQESQAPITALSDSLGRMASSLSTTHGTGDQPCSREQLARELAVCIESLQFHDRLSQQLMQVRNILASVAANGLRKSGTGKSLTAGSAEGADDHPAQEDDWQALVENLRARFTSESHLILFNLLMPASGGGAGPTALHANEGSVELF